MARRVALLTGVSAFLFAVPAFAHHPGSSSNTGSAGPVTTISASTLEAGHGAVAFLAEYIRLGGVGDAQLVDAASRHIHAHSIRTIESYAASAAYGITDDLMISARFSYVRRTDIREGHHAHGPGGIVSNTVDVRGDAGGLGDITVLGRTFGVAEVNSGGTTIYVSRGVRASYGGVSAFATVGVPVYNRLNGIQSEPTYRVFGGVAYAF